MKKLSILALVLAFVTATPFIFRKPRADAQVGVGGNVAPDYATNIAQCPVAAGTAYFLCIVVPGGTTQPFLALSVATFNGGAPFPINVAGPAGPQGPQGPAGPAGPVQSFGTAICPAFSVSGKGANASITIGPGCTETTP